MTDLALLASGVAIGVLTMHAVIQRARNVDTDASLKAHANELASRKAVEDQHDRRLREQQRDVELLLKATGTKRDQQR